MTLFKSAAAALGILLVVMGIAAGIWWVGETFGEGAALTILLGGIVFMGLTAIIHIESNNL